MPSRTGATKAARTTHTLSPAMPQSNLQTVSDGLIVVNLDLATPSRTTHISSLAKLQSTPRTAFSTPRTLKSNLVFGNLSDYSFCCPRTPSPNSRNFLTSPSMAFSTPFTCSPSTPWRQQLPKVSVAIKQFSGTIITYEALLLVAKKLGTLSPVMSLSWILFSLSKFRIVLDNENRISQSYWTSVQRKLRSGGSVATEGGEEAGGTLSLVMGLSWIVMLLWFKVQTAGQREQDLTELLDKRAKEVGKRRASCDQILLEDRPGSRHGPGGDAAGQ